MSITIKMNQDNTGIQMSGTTADETKHRIPRREALYLLAI